MKFSPQIFLAFMSGSSIVIAKLYVDLNQARTEIANLLSTNDQLKNEISKLKQYDDILTESSIDTKLNALTGKMEQVNSLLSNNIAVTAFITITIIVLGSIALMYMPTINNIDGSIKNNLASFLEESVKIQATQIEKATFTTCKFNSENFSRLTNKQFAAHVDILQAIDIAKTEIITAASINPTNTSSNIIEIPSEIVDVASTIATNAGQIPPL